MRVRNFCAGSAAIPEPVLEEVRSELLEWGNAGMSIMEMSHRSSIFDEVASNAKQDFIELLNTYSFKKELFENEKSINLQRAF